jgi:hypothetical protein
VRFTLLPASYPDFADSNIASVRAMVQQSIQVNGLRVPLILAKPLGMVPHGGMQVVREGTPEHAAPQGLVERLGSSEATNNCPDFGSLAAPSGIALMDWRSTLRKAALDFVGRLPTDAENQREAALVAHSGIGTAMLATPEQLDRRVRAIAGFPWMRDLNPMRLAQPNGRDNWNHWLRQEFYLPYGGINSDTIVRRVADPSGIIVGIAQRMATEVACRGTAWDFTLPQTERRFFRNVQIDTVSEAGGNAVPGNQQLIKQNIAALHSLILGEQLSADDPEVERTFQLFLDTWRETRTSGMGGMPNNNLRYECQGRQNPLSGAELPEMQRITEDRNGTIRAWMAVMTYLFSDYKFLYQ